MTHPLTTEKEPDVPVNGFLAQMHLDPAGPDRWSAGTGGGPAGVARGVLAAQAMVAAGRSVDTRWRWVHAVHVTHLGEGEPAGPVEHRVERVHDTDHGAVRLVRSAQGGNPLALATVTFATPRRGRGPTHQDAPAPDDLPDPHALPATVTAGSLDVRHVDRPRWERAATPAARNRIWMRFTEEIPDEILLHAAALVRAADLLLVEPVAPPPTGEWTDLETGRGLRTAALDLSVRFHRGFRADDWILHEHESPSAADYRAFTTGRFLSSMGRLVATVSQETALLPVAEHTTAALSSAGPRTPEDG
ncbi:acyl-CoA thioesterase II [Pseudonocardia aurantiaca]|uniref:Acyl-CoA thioesterase n=1 Tax=Pseudonocardia aurantiaca TaxID=75290 RepID=A0ABW4FMB0_9PSEU